MTYLTAQGYQKPSFGEIRQQVEAFILSLPAYGPGTDLSAEGPLGQLIAAQTTWASSLADGAQEVYTSRDPDQATGISLDEIFGELGTRRFPASPATAYGVLLWATPSTSLTIPAGSQAKAANIPKAAMSLQSDVVFPSASSGPHQAVLLRVPGSLASGDVLSVVLNGMAYTHTTGVSESRPDALTALATALNAGGFSSTGSAAYRSIQGADYIVVMGDNFTLTTFSSNFTLSQVAQSGIFQATTTGELSLPSGSLDTILTPVTNWLGVEQPAEAVAGTDIETDASYRIRGRQRQRSGTGTDEAIATAVASVVGVSASTCTSNRTSTTDIDGRPANSFEVLVAGGNDGEVANAIARTMPSGIKPFGLSYTDPGIQGTVPSGRKYWVNFSRPAPVYAWVSVTVVSHDPDGGLPADYATAIKDAVAAFGKANFGLGSDYVLQKLYTAVYQVPGIYSVTLQIATTVTEGGTPSYVGTNIAVDARHFLVFDQSRVALSG